VSDTPSFWFPVKRYGWGWGPPVCWQGWAVLVGYFVLVITGILELRAHGAGAVFFYLIALTLLLVVIIAAKGEKPLRWRWDGR
jgi:hypothetical protein